MIAYLKIISDHHSIKVISGNKYTRKNLECDQETIVSRLCLGNAYFAGSCHLFKFKGKQELPRDAFPGRAWKRSS